MKIAICDDDQRSRELLHHYCDRFFRSFCAEETKLRGSQDHCEIEEFADGQTYLESGLQADILLLDVEMEGLDGLRVKELLGRQKSGTRILFISSHEEAMPEAFGWQVYGFLTKPLEYERFEQKMKQIMERLGAEYRCVQIHGVAGEQRVLLSDILYLEAQDKYAYLFVDGAAKPLFDGRGLGEWKQELEAYGFSLSHKSYLVNLARVDRIEKDVLLEGGLRVPLSRRMRKEFCEQHRKHLVRTAWLGGERYV